MGFAGLKENLGAGSKKTLVIAWGLDAGVLQASREALDQEFLDEVVVTGPQEKIETEATIANLDLEGFSIHPASTPEEGAAEAVRLIRDGRGDLLMKGHLSTGVILRAVLNKEKGIRSQPLLSHIAIIELPTPRLILLTDAAMNIKPDFKQKGQILNNAIEFAWSIGLTNPKVAVLASVETVNPQ